MIVEVIPFAKTSKEAERLLKRYPAVLADGCGAVVQADTADDLAALKLLVEKACLCAVHTRAAGCEARLDSKEVKQLHADYIDHYAKQYDGKNEGEE